MRSSSARPGANTSSGCCASTRGWRKPRRRLASIAATFIACWTTLVFPAHAGSALLSWTPPTTNVDGSPLVDLAQYRIAWGCSVNGQYPSSTTITAPASSYRLEGLPDAGTCYFVATALNSRGQESARSNQASKFMGALQAPASPTTGPTIEWTDMAFGVEAVGGTSGTSSDHSVAFTVTSANLLMVGVALGDDIGFGEIGAVAYGAQTMTAVASSLSTDSNWSHVQWYRLFSPTAGTANVTADTDGVSLSSLHIISFIDADIAGTPFGTPSIANNTTANPSVTVVDSAAGNIVVSVVSNDNSSGATTQTSGTLIFEIEDLGSDNDMNAQYQTASGASTACTWTQSGSGTGWAASGVAVKGTGGAAAASLLFPPSRNLAALLQL